MADSSLSAPYFSLAVLGDLRYNDDTQHWILEIGHHVANLEYLSQDWDHDRVGPAHLPKALTQVNEAILAKRLGPEIKCDRDIPECIREMRTFVKAMYKERFYALWLIGICSWYLGKARTLPSDASQERLRAVAANWVNEVKSGCETLSIDIEGLWSNLLQKLSKDQRLSDDQKLSEDQTTHAIRQLLQELSKPLRVLIISADPKNVSRLRLDEERSEGPGQRCHHVHGSLLQFNQDC